MLNGYNVSSIAEWMDNWESLSFVKRPLMFSSWLNVIFIAVLAVYVWRRFAAILITTLLQSRFGISVRSAGFFSIKQVVVCERSSVCPNDKRRILFSLGEISLRLNVLRRSPGLRWRLISVVVKNPKYYIYVDDVLRERSSASANTGSSVSSFLGLFLRWRRSGSQMSNENIDGDSGWSNSVNGFKKWRLLISVSLRLMRVFFWLIDLNVRCLAVMVTRRNESQPFGVLLVANIHASCALKSTTSKNGSERSVSVIASVDIKGTRICSVSQRVTDTVEAFIMKVCRVELSASRFRTLYSLKVVDPTWKCSVSDVFISQENLLKVLRNFPKATAEVSERPAAGDTATHLAYSFCNTLAGLVLVDFVPILSLEVNSVQLQVAAPWGNRYSVLTTTHFNRFEAHTIFTRGELEEACNLSLSSYLSGVKTTLANTGCHIFQLESFALSFFTKFKPNGLPLVGHSATSAMATPSPQMQCSSLQFVAGRDWEFALNLGVQSPTIRVDFSKLFAALHPRFPQESFNDEPQTAAAASVVQPLKLSLQELLKQFTVKVNVRVASTAVSFVGEENSMIEGSLSLAELMFTPLKAQPSHLRLGESSLVASKGDFTSSVCEIEGFTVPFEISSESGILRLISNYTLKQTVTLDLGTKVLFNCLGCVALPLATVLQKRDSSSAVRSPQLSLLKFAFEVKWAVRGLRVLFPSAKQRTMVCNFNVLQLHLFNHRLSFLVEQLLVELVPTNAVYGKVEALDCSSSLFNASRVSMQSSFGNLNVDSVGRRETTSLTPQKVLQVIDGKLTVSKREQLADLSASVLGVQVCLQRYILCNLCLAPFAKLISTLQMEASPETKSASGAKLTDESASNAKQVALNSVSVAYVNCEIVLPNNMPTRLYGRQFQYRLNNCTKTSARSHYSLNFAQGLYWNVFVPTSTSETMERNFIAVEPATLLFYPQKLDFTVNCDSTKVEEQFTNRIFKVLADKWSFLIPHQFILSDLVDNFVAGFKAVRQYHGHVPKTEPPNLTIDVCDRSVVQFSLKRFEFLFEESILEQRLSVIFELGLQQRQAELQRKADFQRFSSGASLSGKSSQTKSRNVKSGLVHLYPEASAAKLEKVREMAQVFLDEYNARSWIYAVKSWYAENPCVLQDIPQKIESPVNKNRKQFLFRFQATPFELTFVPPVLPGKTVQETIHMFDSRVPPDYEYDDLFPFSVKFNAKRVTAKLRDYPLPIFEHEGVGGGTGLSMKMVFIVAEQLAHYQSKRKIFLPVFDDEEPLLVTRTINALKTFADCEILLDSDKDTVLTYGTPYDVAFELVSQIVDSFNKPNVDPSPQLSSLDKMRFMVHGRYKIKTNGSASLKYHLLGSRSPYFHKSARSLHATHSSRTKSLFGQEGLWYVIGPNVTLTIRSDGVADTPDFEFVSDKLMLQVPNAKPLASSVENRTGTLFHFTGGVKLQAKLSVDPGLVQSKSHTSVVLQIPELTETSFGDKRVYDAFAGFRSCGYFVALSIDCAHSQRDYIAAVKNGMTDFSNYLNVNANSVMGVVNAMQIDSDSLSCLKINKGLVFKNSVENAAKPRVIKLLRSISVKLNVAPLLVAFVQDTDTQNGSLGMRVRASSICGSMIFFQRKVTNLPKLSVNSAPMSTYEPESSTIDGANELDYSASKLGTTPAAPLDNKDATTWVLDDAEVVVKDVESRVFAMGDALDCWKDDEAFSSLKSQSQQKEKLGSYSSVYIPCVVKVNDADELKVGKAGQHSAVDSNYISDDEREYDANYRDSSSEAEGEFADNGNKLVSILDAASRLHDNGTGLKSHSFKSDDSVSVSPVGGESDTDVSKEGRSSVFRVGQYRRDWKNNASGHSSFVSKKSSSVDDRVLGATYFGREQSSDSLGSANWDSNGHGTAESAKPTASTKASLKAARQVPPYKFWLIHDDSIWYQLKEASDKFRGIFMHKFGYSPLIKYYKSNDKNEHSVDGVSVSIQRDQVCLFQSRFDQLSDELATYKTSLSSIEYRRQVFDSMYWRVQEKMLQSRISVLLQKQAALKKFLDRLEKSIASCGLESSDNAADPDSSSTASQQRLKSTASDSGGGNIVEERFSHNYVIHYMQLLYNHAVRNVLIRFADMQTHAWSFQYFHTFSALSVFKDLIAYAENVSDKEFTAAGSSTPDKKGGNHNGPADTNYKKSWKTRLSPPKNPFNAAKSSSVEQLGERIASDLLEEGKRSGLHTPLVSTSALSPGQRSQANLALDGGDDWKSEWSSQKKWLQSCYRPSRMQKSPNFVPKNATVAASFILHCICPQINFESTVRDHQDQVVSVLLAAARATVQAIGIYDFDGQQGLSWSAVSDAGLRERLMKNRLVMEVDFGQLFVARGNKEVQKSFSEQIEAHENDSQLFLDPNFLDFTGDTPSYTPGASRDSSSKAVWPLWLPLESFVDDKQPLGNLQKVVDQIVLGVWRDTVNNLYVKSRLSASQIQDSYLDGEASAQNSSEEKEKSDHSNADSTRVWFPRFTLEADGEQFYSIVEVIRNLLIYRDPSGAARNEKLQSTVYSIEQGQRIDHIRQAITQLQQRIRHLEAYIGYSLDDANGERSKFVSRLLHYSEDLYTLMLAARQISQKRSNVLKQNAESRSSALAWRAQVEVGTMKWIMKKRGASHQARYDLALATLNSAEFGMAHFQNQSSDMNFKIGQVCIRNLLQGNANSNFVELLGPFIQSQGGDNAVPDFFRHSNAMVQIKMRELPPVAGISVLETLEVNMYPMLIQLTNDMGHELYGYFFPEKQQANSHGGGQTDSAGKAPNSKDKGGKRGEESEGEDSSANAQQRELLSPYSTSLKGAGILTGVGADSNKLDKQSIAAKFAALRLLAVRRQDSVIRVEDSSIANEDPDGPPAKATGNGVIFGSRNRSRSHLEFSERDLAPFGASNVASNGDSKGTEPLLLARTLSQIPSTGRNSGDTESVAGSDSTAAPSRSKLASKLLFAKSKGSTKNSSVNMFDLTTSGWPQQPTLASLKYDKGLATAPLNASTSVSRSEENGNGAADSAGVEADALDFLLQSPNARKDQWNLMKERAALNRTFIFIKISETYMCLSYKGPKEKNLLDLDRFVFSLPTLEYRNRLWTSLELFEAVKKDITHVALLHLGSLVKEKIFQRKKKSNRLTLDAVPPPYLSPTGESSYSKLKTFKVTDIPATRSPSPHSPSPTLSSKLNRSFLNSSPTLTAEGAKLAAGKHSRGATVESTTPERRKRSIFTRKRAQTNASSSSSKSSIKSKASVRSSISRVFLRRRLSKGNAAADESSRNESEEKAKLLFGNN